LACEECSVRQTYFVPVRESQAGTLALRTGQLVSGERVGLAFTSEASLLLTMGPFQHWVRLAAEPLRDMLAPLGVQRVRIDPRPASELRPEGLPQPWATGDAEPRAPKVPCVHRARRHGRSHGVPRRTQVLPSATGQAVTCRYPVRPLPAVTATRGTGYTSSRSHAADAVVSWSEDDPAGDDGSAALASAEAAAETGQTERNGVGAEPPGP
jgi:hypothetical protein